MSENVGSFHGANVIHAQTIKEKTEMFTAKLMQNMFVEQGCPNFFSIVGLMEAYSTWKTRSVVNAVKHPTRCI